MQKTAEFPEQAKWQFWIDRGGTFTDIVAITPDGQLLSHKLLSENPEQYQDAAVTGIRYFLGLKESELIPADRVAAVKMGTTVATNALLERKGEPTLLVISEGFADALQIGYQNRPRLFDRHIQRPELLYHSVLEVKERISSDGIVLTELNEATLKQQLQAAFDSGLRGTAIVFLHGYHFPQHEQRVAEIAKQIGFTQISCSHQVSPLIKLVSRGDTTVVDAYLSPILRRYVDQVSSQMPGVPLFFMQSSGALSSADSFQGKDAILSGPAGGIVGMARTAKAEGFDKVIGFDMGGTSTDVSHFSGEFEREFDTQVAGVRMRAPMMSIHTVAAGGGSLLSYDGARLRVGPESAGANPGPACYRRGGSLAVTDANVMLGKIQPDFFPHVFGPHANQPLDTEVVNRQFTALAEQVEMSAEALAEGFIQIAVQQMANAIKKISVARGYDVSRYALQCFGGAAAQHACLVAEALGIQQVLVHPFAGVLSAYGMGLADQGLIREQTLNLRLSVEQFEALSAAIDSLTREAEQALAKQYSVAGEVEALQRVHLRYQGSDLALAVPFARLDCMQQSYETLYQQRFGFLQADKALMVDTISVEVVKKAPSLREQVSQQTPKVITASCQSTQFFSAGQWHQAGLYQRQQLASGSLIRGPAIISESHATTVIEPNWVAEVSQGGSLLLCRQSMRTQQQISVTEVDPVMLEVFNNAFMNIAEQMGLQLQNTAMSINIKERLDFSCAVFDAGGNLVANAPHVPVHLGSMGESIKSVMAQFAGKMQPGDVFVLNDPYAGGTHLPDITVITPVFIGSQSEPAFYVGSRGHHADVGGISPGSIPAFSSHIEQEGIRISGFKLVEQGVFKEQEILSLLQDTDYPARNPEQNIADLRAQIAANEKGVQELNKLVKEYSLEIVNAYMMFVQDNAEAAVRKAISRLQDGTFRVQLDNGSQIHVAITVNHQQRSAQIDFSDSSTQQLNNFNAPKAVAVAAVLFVFRTLVEDDIPLNAGCLRPITLIIPLGSMLNPVYPAAVVAGNVETSTCITNALYGALGVMASAQPTMNNLSFGNAQYQYYETLAGGSGAGGLYDQQGKLIGGFNGTDVVQTLMTNSRLTDPEVLESRFPVQVQCHAIKPASGGKGRWHGGNGAFRRIKFLQEMTVSILANGRQHAAFGLAGGESGAKGINRLIRADGMSEELASSTEVEVHAGDQIEIETPGGGGFGRLE